MGPSSLTLAFTGEMPVSFTANLQRDETRQSEFMIKTLTAVITMLYSNTIVCLASYYRLVLSYFSL